MVNKGGRPRKELEAMEFNGWDQLDAMIVWSNEVYCAEQLGINIDTLASRIKERTGLSFSEYKDQKKERIRTQLRKKQYELAMSGNATLLIWLGKNELGQTDKVEQDISQRQININLAYQEE